MYEIHIRSEIGIHENISKMYGFCKIDNNFMIAIEKLDKNLLNVIAEEKLHKTNDEIYRFMLPILVEIIDALVKHLLNIV